MWPLCSTSGPSLCVCACGLRMPTAIRHKVTRGQVSHQRADEEQKLPKKWDFGLGGPFFTSLKLVGTILAARRDAKSGFHFVFDLPTSLASSYGASVANIPRGVNGSGGGRGLEPPLATPLDPPLVV